VLYLDNLPSIITEDNVHDILSQFGQVENVIVLKKKPSKFHAGQQDDAKNNTLQALVQMKSIQDAMHALETLYEKPTIIQGLPVSIAYSRNQELRQRTSASSNSPIKKSPKEDEPVNRILLVTVQNPMYPVTTDLMEKVFGVFGRVEKIVIFIKAVGLQVRLFSSGIFDSS